MSEQIQLLDEFPGIDGARLGVPRVARVFRCVCLDQVLDVLGVLWCEHRLVVDEEDRLLLVYPDPLQNIFHRGQHPVFDTPGGREAQKLCTQLREDWLPLENIPEAATFEEEF